LREEGVNGVEGSRRGEQVRKKDQKKNKRGKKINTEDCPICLPPAIEKG